MNLADFARLFSLCRKHSTLRVACSLILVFAATIASSAQTFSLLARLGPGDGARPISLIQGPDGNFYGAAFEAGGHLGTGSIFKVTPAGVITALHVFCQTGAPCVDGSHPNGIIFGTDGNLYGTTRSGGARNGGSIFRITTTGTLTTLYSFCPGNFCTDGEIPESELLQASDGNFYGTTNLGGGTVFKITASGEFTSLHSFCSQSSCTDGAAPIAGLLEARNGLLYGTTSEGGTSGANCPSVNGCGTLFKMTTSGKVTTLYSFCAQANCADGSHPGTRLLQAADGKIYGATSGTIFRIATSGAVAFTTLHSFTPSEGIRIQGLIQATDGNFYGTAESGGISNLWGTLFKMTPAGDVTVLFNFCNTSACKLSVQPSGVMQATNGLFYGTTLGVASGTLFTFGFPPFIKTLPTAGAVGASVIIYGNDLSGAAAVTFNGIPANFVIVSPVEITTSVPAGASAGKVKVTTPAGTLVSDVAFRVTN